MLKRKFYLGLLLLLIALVNSSIFTVRAQKAGDIKGTQAQTLDVEHASLHRYREISALPVSERRELFVQASAAEKSSLWRVHLALSLAIRPELNREQREVLLDTIALATPELFSLTSESPLWKAKVDEPLQLLRQRALSAYPKKEAAGILANIGDDEAEGTLLQKYINISSRSLAERKELFAKSGGKDKSDLWRFHLALYLANRSKLNQEQREVILDAMSLATPEFFSLSPDNPLWKAQVDKPLQLINKRALAVFSKSEGAEIFNKLGGQEPSSSGLEPDPDPNQKCTCSHNSDWCLPYDCTGNFCRHTTSGCGTFWAYACTGLCYDGGRVK